MSVLLYNLLRWRRLNNAWQLSSKAGSSIHVELVTLLCILWDPRTFLATGLQYVMTRSVLIQLVHSEHRALTDAYCLPHLEGSHLSWHSIRWGLCYTKVLVVPAHDHSSLGVMSHGKSCCRSRVRKFLRGYGLSKLQKRLLLALARLTAQVVKHGTTRIQGDQFATSSCVGRAIQCSLRKLVPP